MDTVDANFGFLNRLRQWSQGLRCPDTGCHQEAVAGSFPCDG